MRKPVLILLLTGCVLLSGCSSILDREYSSVEEHSSKYWESEAAGTLRAESYQDIVNDLLILIGKHTESATVRLYNYKDDMHCIKSTFQTAARPSSPLKSKVDKKKHMTPTERILVSTAKY